MEGLKQAGDGVSESPRTGKELHKQLEEAWTGQGIAGKKPLHSKAMPAPWQRQLLDRTTYPDDVNEKYILGRVSNQ
jgi:hypothetical protein